MESSSSFFSNLNMKGIGKEGRYMYAVMMWCLRKIDDSYQFHLSVNVTIINM